MNMRYVGVIGAAAALGALVVLAGRSAGAQEAEAALERMTLLWPAVMDFPSQERAFLAGLALTCRLHNEEKTPEAVIACLRRGAADPAVILPKGAEKADAPAKLERFLSYSTAAGRGMKP